MVCTALAVIWQSGALSRSTPAPTLTEDATPRMGILPPTLDLATPPQGSRQVGLRAGELAPDFEFSDYSGERVKLSDYRGRAVFLNFWATWCGPCRVELPDMETVLLESTEEKLAVLAINNGERLVAGQAFIDKLDVDLTAIAYDPEAAIVRRYALLGMPTSYLIDADGVITRVVNGQMSLSAMRVAVKEAIAGYDSIKN